MAWLLKDWITWLGTAMPWSPPMTMVLIPTTAPEAATSGPPELPGASLASERMISTVPRFPRVLAVVRLLITPTVAAPRCPQGWPMARTSCPTRRSCVSAMGAAGRSCASIRSNARSISGALAIGLARNSAPSASSTRVPPCAATW